MLTLATGAAGSAALGCHAPAPQNALANELAAFGHRLENSLAALDARPGGFFTAAKARGYFADVDDSVVLADADEWSRKSFRAMTILGAVHDLDPATRRSPELIRALEPYSRELDDVFMQQVVALSSIDEETERDLHSFASGDVDLVDMLGSALDRESSAHGVGPVSRTKLRALVREVKRGLRVQPARTYADEVLSKVDRVVSMNSRDAARVRITADNLTQRVFSHVFAQTEAAGDGTVYAVTSAAPVPVESHGMIRARGIVRAGGWTIGIGVLIGLAGVIGASAAATFDAAIGGLVVATVGGIFVLLGLIVLIVGLRRRARLRAREALMMLAPPVVR
jgi:hypothetical protein